MALESPINNAYVGGNTKLIFDTRITDLEIKVNGVIFHATQINNEYILDLNDFSPNSPIVIEATYKDEDGSLKHDRIKVYKPRHDLGGMGSTVIRDTSRKIIGVFFKFWLPKVRSVYVRGSFNNWKDVNRLDQLSNSGYWYGFSADARPGDDYKFFVYGVDGNFSEVSDPAARDTIKTRYNSADDQDANAVIVDPYAFKWKYDYAFIDKRRNYRNHIIYQLHWGTFLRPGEEAPLPFETFVSGTNENQKRTAVRKKLSYIKKMNFTAIELLPIHEANGAYNAGYDPSFFFAIESAYGTPDDLRILVDEAHGLGLAVFFDSVINHLTNDETHSSFSQLFIKGWYTKENAPWSNHNQWGGSDWGPDPDFDRKEIRNLLNDCMRMYFNEYHIDGIRFDATTTIPRHALDSMVDNLSDGYRGQGKYLIAEHITDDPFLYIIGDIGFDAGWYKPASKAARYEVLGAMGKGDLNKLRQVFETNYNGEPSTAIKYLLGSHDEVWSSHGRCATVSCFGGQGNSYARMKMRLGWAINVCCLGTPMLFMGTECMTDIGWHEYYGYNGKNQHTPGDGLDWNPSSESYAGQFKKMIRDINNLRNSNGALQTPNTDCTLVHYDTYNSIAAYKRWDYNGCVLLIVINLSDNQWNHHEYQVWTGTPNSKWHEVFNSQDVEYGGWNDSGNSDPSFYPETGWNGLMQGVNVPKWSLMVLKQQL